ncbi:MAG: hypothetical protein LBN21_05830 [Treponema sp.]|jgi:hypothetical protein|nr:hypothetical protein [Treponema sp.]
MKKGVSLFVLLILGTMLYAQDLSIDDAVKAASVDLGKHLTDGSKVAILNFSAGSDLPNRNGTEIDKVKLSYRFSY